MDFNWYFRKRRNYQDQSDFYSDEHATNDSARDEEMNTFEVPFEPFGNMEDTTHGLFQHMEDMLNQIFISSFVPFGSSKIEENIRSDPRSIMLKDPDYITPEKSQDPKSFDMMVADKFVDNDIDEQVSRHGLILDKKSEFRVPQNFSYKKFVSIRTVHSPDGTVEEHKKFTDSEGNVTTTICRSIGDQSYKVTTTEDSQGIKKKEECLTNFDESELSDFENRWLNMKSRKLPMEEPKSDLMLPKSASAGDPSYLTIFKKFFGL